MRRRLHSSILFLSGASSRTDVLEDQELGSETRNSVELCPPIPPRPISDVTASGSPRLSASQERTEVCIIFIYSWPSNHAKLSLFKCRQLPEIGSSVIAKHSDYTPPTDPTAHRNCGAAPYLTPFSLSLSLFPQHEEALQPLIRNDDGKLKRLGNAS
jgi:hypothetical protein